MANGDDVPPLNGVDDSVDTLFTDRTLTRRYLDEFPSALSSVTVETGTAFPSTPADGKLFLRTDESKLYIFFSSTWFQIAVLDASSNLKIGGRYLKE